MAKATSCPLCGALLPLRADAGDCPRCQAAAGSLPSTRLNVTDQGRDDAETITLDRRGDHPTLDLPSTIEAPGDAQPKIGDHAQANVGDQPTLPLDQHEAGETTPLETTEQASLDPRAELETQGEEGYSNPDGENGRGHNLSEKRPSTSRNANIGKLARFELLSVLGRGGFGQVYLAQDPLLDRQVALKVPRILNDDPREARRFLAEAKAAARLRHPNIVATFESGRDGSVYYIASEYVDGAPLSVRLTKSPPSLKQGVEWVRDLARAIAYAHQEGIIHRDLKPANVMIGANGRPQVMDFGLAKRIGERESTSAGAEGAIVGTPAYMAPEQARGAQRDVGPHSDQYALGVILYELMTRRLPFSGDLHIVLLRVVKDLPPTPRSIRPELPADLEAICLKAMEKEPELRYESCEDLASDLDRWLEGRPVLARPVGPLGRFKRWAKREPTLAAATSFTIAALFLALIFAWASASSRSQRIAAQRDRDVANEQAKTAKAQAERDNLLARETQVSVVRNDAQKHRELALRSHNEGDLFHAFSEMLGAQDLAHGIHDDQLTQNCLKTLTDWRSELLQARSIFNIPGQDSRFSTSDHFSHPYFAFRPDGKAFLTQRGKSRLSVQVWDLDSGKPIGPEIEREHCAGALAFSQDGKRLALGGVSGVHDSEIPRTREATRVRVWDVQSGQPIGPEIEHASRVTLLLLPADGQTVITGGPDLPLQWWDARTARPIAQANPASKRPVALQLSHDEKTLVSSHLPPRPEEQTELGQALNRVLQARAPDHLKPVALLQPTIRRWDVASGKESSPPLILMRTDVLPNHGFLPTSFRFSADDRYLLAQNRDVTFVIDPNTLEKLGPPRPYQSDEGSSTTGVMSFVEFGPEGPVVLHRTSSPRFGYLIRLHNALTDEAIGPEMISPASSVFRMAFSADGHTFVTATARERVRKDSVDPEEASGQLWDAANGRTIGNEFTTVREFFSPDGKTLAILPTAPRKSSRTSYQLVSARTGKPVGQRLATSDYLLPRPASNRPAPDELSPLRLAQFTPDGSGFLMARDDAVSVFDAQLASPFSSPLEHEHRIRTVTYEPGGRELLTLDDSYDTIRRWDTRSGALRETHERSINHFTSNETPLLFSPDGSRLFSAPAAGYEGSGQEARFTSRGQMREARHGRPLGAPLLLEGGAPAAAFSADSQKLVTGSGRAIAAEGPAFFRLWDVSTGQPLGPPLKGGWDRIAQVAIRPDARVVYTADFHDRPVRLFSHLLRDATTGEPISQEIAASDLENDRLLSLGQAQFRPDGRVLAILYKRLENAHSQTQSFGGVRYWDATTGEPTEPRFDHRQITTFVFSPNSRTLVTASGDGVVRTWNATSGLQIGQDQVIGGSAVAIAFSPHSDQFAVAYRTSQRSEVRLFPNIQTLSPVPAETRADLARQSGFLIEPNGYRPMSPEEWERYHQVGITKDNAPGTSADHSPDESNPE